MYPFKLLLSWVCVERSFVAYRLQLSHVIIKLTTKKNRQHFCLRNQIRNDISYELSGGRRFICNIKVYFLPEILKVYIAICHDRCLERYKIKAVLISKLIKHFLTVAETSHSLHAR